MSKIDWDLAPEGAVAIKQNNGKWKALAWINSDGYWWDDMNEQWNEESLEWAQTIATRQQQTKTVADAYEWANGEWPKKEYEYIKFRQGRFFFSIGRYLARDDGCYIVCTREQFEAYAKEQEGEKWTHKNPPPVGAKCKYALGESDTWWDCEIISHKRLVIHCPHIESDEHCGLQIVGEIQPVRFKPIKPKLTKAEAWDKLMERKTNSAEVNTLKQQYDII